MTVDTIAARNKRIKELEAEVGRLQQECETQHGRTADQFDRAEAAEAEVKRLRRVMVGCAALIDTLPATSKKILAVHGDGPTNPRSPISRKLLEYETYGYEIERIHLRDLPDSGVEVEASAIVFNECGDIPDEAWRVTNERDEGDE